MSKSRWLLVVIAILVAWAIVAAAIFSCAGEGPKVAGALRGTWILPESPEKILIIGQAYYIVTVEGLPSLRPHRCWTKEDSFVFETEDEEGEVSILRTTYEINPAGTVLKFPSGDSPLGSRSFELRRRGKSIFDWIK